MHDIVFEKFGAQKKDDLRKYAGQLGLDLARYDVDFAAAEAKVKADMQHGVDIGVDGTPTLYLNGRRYDGPLDPKYFGMVIDEELAARAGAAKPAEPGPTGAAGGGSGSAIGSAAGATGAATGGSGAAIGSAGGH